MPDEIGWLSDDEEATLDRIAAQVAAKMAAERSKLSAAELEAEDQKLIQACAAAQRYRIEMERRHAVEKPSIESSEPEDDEPPPRPTRRGRRS
jgi:hypothetical protein